MIKKIFGKFGKKDKKNEEIISDENIGIVNEKENEIDNIKEEKIEEFVAIVEEKSVEKVESRIEKENDIVDSEEEQKENKKGLFKSLKEKLGKSRAGLFAKMKNIFSKRTVIDEDMYEELEELLIQSDIGFEMTMKIVETLEKEIKERGIKDPNLVYDVLKDVLKSFLIEEDIEFKVNGTGMNVVLVIGVNGVGKTTTIGKIASKLKKEGKSVVLGAADTFRAAAIEQLEEWANRSGVELVKHSHGADPGAVVFDTLKAAKSRKADVAIIDTAGRLHNKNNLMAELAKINKIIKKELGENAFYESILVIDGTTGQNGLSQAKAFDEVTDLTGLIITKMDGTAKGGIIFAISEILKKPVKFIGVGEGIEDLRVFNAEEFIGAIFD